MSDRYIDPNSGAAPQPGGYASGGRTAVLASAPKVSEPAAHTAESSAVEGEPDPSAPIEPAVVEPVIEPVEPAEPAEPVEPIEPVVVEPVVESWVEIQDVLPAYDPTAHGVEEVKAYLAEHPDEVEAVLEAERAGKARKGLISGD